jgi:ligand-binding sensor domain-containing protein
MKLLNHSFTFTILVLLIKVCPALSQETSFNKVSLPDESLSGTVSGITQDLKGNIWFACQRLFRYDGTHLKSYVHDPLNAGSVAISYIECVFADRDGNIWAGTYGDGLEKFDPNAGVFTHYRHDEKDSSSISGDTVTCILQDHEGFLWVGDDYRGLNRMDIKTGKFIHYRHKESDPNSLSFDQVRVIYEDREGVIWVGTGAPFLDEDPGKKGGLSRFNRKTGTFTCYLHNENDPHSLIDNRVRAIFEDSHGNFWVGTAGDGLHTMDRKMAFSKGTPMTLHIPKN